MDTLSGWRYRQIIGNECIINKLLRKNSCQSYIQFSSFNSIHINFHISVCTLGGCLPFCGSSSNMTETTLGPHGHPATQPHLVAGCRRVIMVAHGVACPDVLVSQDWNPVPQNGGINFYWKRQNLPSFFDNLRKEIGKITLKSWKMSSGRGTKMLATGGGRILSASQGFWHRWQNPETCNSFCYFLKIMNPYFMIS